MLASPCRPPPSTRLEENFKPRAGFIFPYPDDDDDDGEEKDDDDYGTDNIGNIDEVIECYKNTIVDNVDVDERSADSDLHAGLSPWSPAIVIG